MEPLITPALLASTGINIPDDEVADYLELINDQLLERIGEAVVETLDDDKLDTLEELQEKASDEELHTWMQANVPDLDAIIQEELDILLGDAAESSTTLNSPEA